jgi:hypothetical protein
MAELNQLGVSFDNVLAMLVGMAQGQVNMSAKSWPRSVEDYPFGDGGAVFKVAGRMFALVPLEGNPAPSVSNATPTSPLSCGR